MQAELGSEQVGEIVFEGLGLSLVDTQLEKLSSYLKMLCSWSKRIDLVSPGDEKELLQRHLLDSLASWTRISSWMSERGLNSPNYILDVGSGAGLPGIVWAALLENTRVVLLEPREKRVVFLKEVVSRLGLGNAEVSRARLEESKTEARVDIITSRALGLGEELLARGEQILASKGFVAELLGPNEGLGLKERTLRAESLGYVSRETLSYKPGSGRGERLVFLASRS